MKKKTFKVLSTTALITALLTPSVFAGEISTPSEPSSVSINESTKTLDQLVKKYNLQEVKEVPEGIVPLEFKSIEEAEKYLEASANEPSVLTNFEPLNTEDRAELNNVAPLALVTKTITKLARTDSSYKLNVTATYLVENNRINSVSKVESGLTGDTTNLGWRQNSYSITRMDSNRSVGIDIRGTLIKYVVIDGKKQSVEYTKNAYVEFYESDR
ncbi:hypothetical protein AM501_02940 [Aneurinibacillus migulanus]|uniref:hypothetical protein n=1 Tax=Aneurinibacillus migulanus TaxID=47500 RepID=UPI0005BBCEAA|nr:hypothetical protein [Aneurinibacillus migulanus]KIV50782.1 hypothetical protein TS64_26565 [Aneurinibacillus migulanus]KPD09680.1 hypothetical protein AM501_02940 [Aneurinibacillus migulanus]